MKITVAKLVMLSLLMLMSFAAAAEPVRGKAIRIADGDTFTLLLDDRTTAQIRLAEIDAPESGQPFGNKSKQALKQLVDGKAVQVEVQTTDQYGRWVGRVYVGGVDVSAELVQTGNAWVFRRYLRDRSLLDLEEQARSHKRGLWATTEAQAVPPWEWRRYGNAYGAPGDCRIKGNINSRGVRIYHVPGSRSYGVTQINESKGERWFCNEAEAQTAGWRAPRR